MKQVITVHPDGTMSGLQRKAGQGIDLRQFGKAEITRASEILWDEPNQMWYVQILSGPYKDEAISVHVIADTDLLVDQIKALAPSGMKIRPGNHWVVLFKEYDEAVKVEIAVLDAFRLKGRL